MLRQRAAREFETDGRSSQCGIDAVDLVRSDGSWRLADAMWTGELDVCEELRAGVDASGVRPVEWTRLGR